MKLEDIKDNACILAEGYIHNEVRQQLLKEKRGIANVSILSLSTYMASEIVKHEDVVIYEYANIIKTLKLEHFKEIALTPYFLHEIIQMVRDGKKYNMDISSLAKDDAYQKELQQIIAACSTYRLDVEDMYEKFWARQDFHNVYIYDAFPDVYKNKVYAHMELYGAKRLQTKRYQPICKLYYVLNKKEEVEALARYILDEDVYAEDAKITILNEEYRPLITQIFTRYKIPHYFLNARKGHRLVFKYRALLAYYMKPCKQNLRKLWEADVFEGVYHHAFYEYIELFDKDIDDDFDHVQQADITDDVIHQREYEALLRLETQAKDIKMQVEPYILALQNCKIEQAFVKIDEIICQFHHFKSVRDTQIAYKVRALFKAAYPYLEPLMLPLLYAQLEQLQLEDKEAIEGIGISILSEPQAYKKYHFMLGASSDNFPQFPSKKGIFSEDYLALCDFPSLDERFSLYQEGIENTLHASDIFIGFYPMSDYQGKEKEAAFEIERFVGVDKEHPAVYYSLQYNHQTYKVSASLSKGVSEQLFFKEQVLYGSISSLEKFNNCPFQYFVAQGLCVREPQAYHIHRAKTGKLLHGLLEQLLSTQGKAYPLVEQKMVEGLLEKPIRDLQKLHPQWKGFLEIVKQQALHNILKNFVFMSDMEVHSSLAPSALEYRFKQTITLEKTDIVLRGIIDRIDENQDFISIIDYKSTPHDLKEEAVFSGLKLQLLTYLYALAKTSDKRILGSFYYSLKNSIASAPYASFKGKTYEVCKQEVENLQNEFLKSKQLVGWTFDEAIEVMDDDLKHQKSISKKADGAYTARTNIYAIEKITNVVEALYNRIANQLLTGKVAIAPMDCTYCMYNSICHYQGMMVEKPSLEVDECIYQVKKGKEVAHDTME
ncbi:MAG: PD-(D/E)XK nuclease family protein [Breznakia sp.]